MIMNMKWILKFWLLNFHQTKQKEKNWNEPNSDRNTCNIQIFLNLKHISQVYYSHESNKLNKVPCLPSGSSEIYIVCLQTPTLEIFSIFTVPNYFMFFLLKYWLDWTDDECNINTSLKKPIDNYNRKKIIAHPIIHGMFIIIHNFIILTIFNVFKHWARSVK